MRSYRAAKRAATQDPVVFEVTYEVAGEDGDLVEKTESFAARGDVSALMLSELAAQADVDTASPEGLALIRDFFAQAFGDPEEYRRFFKVASRHLDEDTVMSVMADLTEDMMGRPTQRPSASPAGPSTSGPGSRVDSPLPEGVTELPGGFRVQAPTSETDRAQAVDELERLASSG